MLSGFETEKATVRRLQRASFVAWGFSLLLCVGMLGHFYATTLGPLQQQTYWETIYLWSPLVGMIGAVSLVVAIVTTLAWFFRSRTIGLAAIEARLARLEQLLSRETARE